MQALWVWGRVIATPPLEEHVLLEAINALNVYGSKKAAAEALGMKYRTFQSRIDIARGRGLHLSQGVQQTIQRARLHPGEAKGGWKHVYDDDGRPEATAQGLRVWGDSGLICDVVMSEADQLGLAVAILQKYLERRAERQIRTGNKSGSVYHGM